MQIVCSIYFVLCNFQLRVKVMKEYDNWTVVMKAFATSQCDYFPVFDAINHKFKKLNEKVLENCL